MLDSTARRARCVYRPAFRGLDKSASLEARPRVGTRIHGPNTRPKRDIILLNQFMLSLGVFQLLNVSVVLLDP